MWTSYFPAVQNWSVALEKWELGIPYLDCLSNRARGTELHWLQVNQEISEGAQPCIPLRPLRQQPYLDVVSFSERIWYL